MAREILGIPNGYTLLTLVIVGKKMEAIHPSLSEGQAEKENVRPERKPLEEFAFHNEFDLKE
jgi:hypothetical protein